MKKAIVSIFVATTLSISSFVYAASSNSCVINIEKHVVSDEGEPYIELSDCELNDEDLPAVVDFLNQHSEIKTANFAYNNIHAQGGRYLSQLTSVQWLILDSNHLGDEGVTALANNTVIDDLWLYDNQITDQSIPAIAKNQKLAVLLLTQNEITDKGAIILAENSGIQYLDLDYNKIGNNGAIALAKDKHLIQLRLGHNTISDEGALAFAMRKEPLWLDIEYNYIGAAAIQQLLLNTNLEVNVYGNPGAPAETDTLFSSKKINVNKKDYFRKLNNHTSGVTRVRSAI